jgi:N-acetylmuramoyl-L-alanine amidase
MAEPARVGGAQLNELPDGSQLTFQLSDAVEYKSFSLDNPPRLVIDLRDARLSPGFERLGMSTVDVRSVRTGVKARTDLRIVLDLHQPMRADVKVSKNGSQGGRRLIVDLFRGAKPTPSVVHANPPRYKPTSVTRTPPRPEPAPVTRAPARAQPAAVAPAKHVVVSPGEKIVIAIDPGHGGKDPGAIGPGRTKEKRVVMQIARRLKRLIDQEDNLRAVLTRNNDRYLRLYDRIKIARRYGADLFISLHADAAPSRDARGASVYILSSGRASSVAAKILADRENAADRIGGVRLVESDEINSVLIDMRQDANLEASYELAENILNKLGAVGFVRKRRVERASFAVLTSPAMPSVLVETAFISNWEEERLLRSERYQNAVADAILRGIRAYYRRRPPRQWLTNTEAIKASSPALGQGFKSFSGNSR